MQKIKILAAFVLATLSLFAQAASDADPMSRVPDPALSGRVQVDFFMKPFIEDARYAHNSQIVYQGGRALHGNSNPAQPLCTVQFRDLAALKILKGPEKAMLGWSSLVGEVGPSHAGRSPASESVELDLNKIDQGFIKRITCLHPAGGSFTFNDVLSVMGAQRVNFSIVK